MLWPKASPLDLDFGLCVWAKLFNIHIFTFPQPNMMSCEAGPTGVATSTAQPQLKYIIHPSSFCNICTHAICCARLFAAPDFMQVHNILTAISEDIFAGVSSFQYWVVDSKSTAPINIYYIYV